MATEWRARSMSIQKQSTTGSIYSPLSFMPELNTSPSSVEPLEAWDNKISSDESLETTGWESSCGGVSEAGEEMDISEEGVQSFSVNLMHPGCGNLVPANAQEDTVHGPLDPTFDMDLGRFLRDRLDGHIMSHPPSTAQPWRTGLYSAIPSTSTDGIDGHEFLWTEAVVVEKIKVNSKPQSLKNLENTLTSLHSRPEIKNARSKKQQKQSRALKRSLRAHRLRLENLDASAKRIVDTATEIYAKRERDFFMTEDEQKKVAEVEMRVWKIRVAARGVRWLRRRAPAEYEELTQNLKEIMLLEVAKNRTICSRLRERYRSVIWGQKGWEADASSTEDDWEREEWDSERSEESDGSDEDSESEDTEDESEEDYGNQSRSRSNSHSSRRRSGGSVKKFPFIRLVVRRGHEE